MTPFPFGFEAQIEKFGVGKTRKIWYNVLFLPADMQSRLPFDRYPRLRVEGEIADIPIANAFIPAGDGRHYLIVAPHVLKDAELAIGDHVEIRFAIADQNKVDVPPALEQAVAANARAKAAWDVLTPGKKRMRAQHVMSAKTPPTERKRTGEAIEAITGFGGDLRACRNSRR